MQHVICEAIRFLAKILTASAETCPVWLVMAWYERMGSCPFPLKVHDLSDADSKADTMPSVSETGVLHMSQLSAYLKC